MFSERLEHGKCDFQHLVNGKIHDFGVLSPQNRLVWASKALPSCNVERDRSGVGGGAECI